MNTIPHNCQDGVIREHTRNSQSQDEPSIHIVADLVQDLDQNSDEPESSESDDLDDAFHAQPDLRTFDSILDQPDLQTFDLILDRNGLSHDESILVDQINALDKKVRFTHFLLLRLLLTVPSQSLCPLTFPLRTVLTLPSS